MTGLAWTRGWEQSGHYGVRGMRERAVASGGSLQLISEPENGTEVVARLAAGHAVMSSHDRHAGG